MFKGDRHPQQVHDRPMEYFLKKTSNQNYMTDQHPSNEIHRVGLREGQLLGNGATDKECAEISAAYLQGKPLPVSDNEVINRINDRLTQTSGYGLYSAWGEE
ncbi:hypothetical protein [Nostoc sp. CHAB 5715]|uniref:hypothetical protein n=1 Tax=Nostoc sp. CHAB 5715 TaxID=2780400 RepID=UPI001E5D8734|nr:hypothetical protein [Nostoc sp. CHAB 5715]MCC5626586.1 hypothetical protein [Nostoc sp. CHAB 5715]